MENKLTPDEATPFPRHHTPTRFERAKYGWLIERQHPIIEWWTGLRFDLEDAKAWTCDSTKAIVFGDWASGGAMLNNLQVETMKAHRSARFLERMKLCVTAHTWSDATQSETLVKSERPEKTCARCNYGRGLCVCIYDVLYPKETEGK